MGDSTCDQGRALRPQKEEPLETAPSFVPGHWHSTFLTVLVPSLLHLQRDLGAAQRYLNLSFGTRLPQPHEYHPGWFILVLSICEEVLLYWGFFS